MMTTLAGLVIVLTMVEVNFLSYLYALLGAILLGAALIAIGMFIAGIAITAMNMGDTYALSTSLVIFTL